MKMKNCCWNRHGNPSRPKLHKLHIQSGYKIVTAKNVNITKICNFTGTIKPWTKSMQRQATSSSFFRVRRRFASIANQNFTHCRSNLGKAKLTSRAIWFKAWSSDEDVVLARGLLLPPCAELIFKDEVTRTHTYYTNDFVKSGTISAEFTFYICCCKLYTRGPRLFCFFYKAARTVQSGFLPCLF